MTNSDLIDFRVKMIDGMIINSWCSKHGDNGKQTRNLWKNYRLWCLECIPEKDPDYQAGVEIVVEALK